ncbi:MAG: ankyrin repeat domain-containing protein [Alphaproteobacteria bacterium GM202ARS2]|nr:ankyrin repeat domain-containing protein [Alphaproteobacteria bacterium GM202ARS2]
MQLLDKEFMTRATPEDIQAELDAGADVNQRDKYGATSLHYAVLFNKKHAVINMLIEAGADISIGCSADIRGGFPVKQMLAIQRKYERKWWQRWF